MIDFSVVCDLSLPIVSDSCHVQVKTRDVTALIKDKDWMRGSLTEQDTQHYENYGKLYWTCECSM